MATIVNTPGQTAPAESASSGMGFLLGAILLIITLVALFVYGLPALRGAAAPATGGINVPDQVDVNVNPGTGGQGQ